MGSAKELKGVWAKEAYKMLQVIANLLREHRIPYILEAGTLLGVVREGRLLPWDTDVDITVLYQNADQIRKLKWKLFLKGYRMRIRRFERNVGPFKKGDIRIIKIQTTYLWLFKHHTLMDIFLKYKIGEAYYWALKGEKYIIKRSPSEYYENTKWIEFMGNLFTVPAKAEEYLAYHYGADWRIPIRQWDYLLDDHCEKGFEE
jgi:lipopolysaccharide cholinephosphotransferase